MRIQEVTRRLKVSASTVSRALNPATQHLISDGTRRRIKKFVQQNGYTPNHAARQLLTGRTNAVGILLPTVFESAFFNDHLTKVLAGVYQVFSENPHFTCKLIVLPRGESLSNLEHQSLLTGIDGLLLSSYSDESISSSHFLPKRLLAKLSRPIVVLNQKLKGNRHINCVYFSNFKAAYKAVTHLIQNGHRDIALIKGNTDVPDIAERVNAYRSAVKDHNLEVSEAFIREGNYLVEGGYQATLSLFKSNGRKPTAIFCINDEMAIGALNALRSLNLRCPQDVAVMGFDGIDLGKYTIPRLTTVGQPTKEITIAGTRLLLDLIQEKIKGPIEQEIPSELIVRDSA